MATLRVGPKQAGQDVGQDVEIKKKILLSFCETPRTRMEMQMRIGSLSRGTFRKTYLEPMLRDDYLMMTIPEKPNSKNQKYLAVANKVKNGLV